MEHHYHQPRVYHDTGREDDTLTTAEFRLTLDASQISELKKTFKTLQSYWYDTAEAGDFTTSSYPRAQRHLKYLIL